jgi:putative hydrolase of the HAD superfamily
VTFTDSLWNGIGGIVIDAVGTLIGPEPSVAEAYARAARRQGVDLDRGDVRARFVRVFRDDEVADRVGAMITDEPAERARWRRIVSAVLPELPDPDRGFAELWEHFACPKSWFCYSDVAPALEVLRSRGLPVHIASNFDARLRRVVAGLPALAALADGLVIASEIGYRKPHPDFYRTACDRLDLAPGCVLCVGDDPENDVLASRRAGLKGVLIDRKSECLLALPRVCDFSELIAPLQGEDLP